MWLCSAVTAMSCSSQCGDHRIHLFRRRYEISRCGNSAGPGFLEVDRFGNALGCGERHVVIGDRRGARKRLWISASTDIRQSSTEPEMTSMKLSMPKPTREMLPASAP